MNAEKMKLLSRKHIQAIAINHGIKGNMKSEDIIQILVKRYPDGVPLHNLPVSSQNITASSRTVVMQWSDAQGRYIEVPVGNRQDQPPPIAGPSQPSSHYRSLGVFGAVPPVDYATGQRPAAPGGSSSIPLNLQTASSNSYKHYRNVAPEFLPGPQMYSASAGPQALSGQTNGGTSHPGTRPHAQQTPYAVPAPSPVWRAPAPPTDTESTPRQRSAAQTREPTPLIDDSYDTGPAPADPSPVDVSHEVQASALSRAPSPSTRPRDAQDSAPEAAQSSLATDSDIHDAVRKMANIAKFQQQCRKSLERMSEITSTSGIICSDLEAVVQQECFHFQRMTTYVDHVNPELAPRWRDEVIWDKACPTFVDDDDNLLEYDTDDENAPSAYDGQMAPQSATSRTTDRGR
ncbi:hypothetical protein OH76DRAFT_541678 [Lentinus brumalis]|uniref:Uncharacterized protein n=1 Tax=Lentinus brumalis TaxID=2498619 RepID=A0A371D9N4_9APHY|nr:hypothetical protein OH76DRAFT_541678 [Polyporus brumalis]